MTYAKWFILPLLSAAATAWAQEPAASFPTKPITFVVPTPAGGNSDVMARLVADKLAKSLGQPVIIENKPGAGQTVGTAHVAKSRPDGYTYLFVTSTPIVMMPFTSPQIVSYDVKRDFVAVSHIGSTPLVLYANTTVPVQSVEQLLALAKQKPGQLSYGSHGTGSSAHVLGELLSKQGGIELIHVPYSGTAPVVNALVGGTTNFGVANFGMGDPFVKDGKLHPIAVTGSKRSGHMPDVPTFAEQGINGMEPFSPWWGLFAPADTPQPIVDKMSDEVRKIVKTPEFEKWFAGFGGDLTALGTREATAEMQAEVERWEAIISKDLADTKFQ